MKNYIAVAALLAAGTAFANADVVAVFNCGGTEADGRAAWMDQNQNGWMPAQMSAGSGIFDNVKAEESGIKLSLTGDGLGSTGPAGSFSANAADGTNPYPIPTALTTLSQGVFGNNAYDTLWGGSVNMWEAGSATLTLGGLKENTDYTVYLFSARANGDSGTVEWLADNASWSVITSSGKEPNSSTVQFAGDATGLNASIVEVSFNTGTATEVSFSTNGAQKFTLNGIVVDQGSTIPEPSAFGLLAGLGALALVASRRRRK